MGLRLTLAAVLGSLANAALAVPPPGPNVLWITAEDLSPDLGCYGAPGARTPNLDRLASQGARFVRAFSVAGVCAPSRSAIITGMHPTSIGTHPMRSKGVPPAHVKCFTEHLRAAGYHCTNNSKTDYNFDCPLTAWDENGPRAHWRGRAPGQHFFAIFNLTVTHEAKIRAPDAETARLTRDLRPEDRHDPAKAELPPYYPDTPVVRRDWARYQDLVTAMDLEVARILQALEDDGLAEHTVVFFFSDHGRGLPRAKRWVYDSGIHVPLIVRWPGVIEPGAVRGELVSLLDLAPTMLSIAGIEAPRHLQGRAFLGPAAGPPRDLIFAARDRMDETCDVIRCARDQRFKYIRNLQPGKPYAQYIHYMDQMPTLREMRRLNAEGKLAGTQRLFFLPEKPAEELYDVEADPHEVRNLAADPAHRERLERLRSALERWTRETGDLGLVPEEELQERLRPGGKWSVTAAPVLEPAGGRFEGPVRVRVSCPTEGASIAYTLEEGEGARWKLAAGDVEVRATCRLRAKACRLGWKDSPEVSASFTIGGPGRR
ncbi:MAG: sulfatase-like hydrolase/transferase [Planctomycetes bacterium]|nr:sulfatase-like hydrolase/transferase [Planctomycetota bacterium]